MSKKKHHPLDRKQRTFLGSPECDVIFSYYQVFASTCILLFVSCARNKHMTGLEHLRTFLLCVRNKHMHFFISLSCARSEHIKLVEQFRTRVICVRNCSIALACVRHFCGVAMCSLRTVADVWKTHWCVRNCSQVFPCPFRTLIELAVQQQSSCDLSVVKMEIN